MFADFEGCCHWNQKHHHRFTLIACYVTAVLFVATPSAHGSQPLAVKGRDPRTGHYENWLVKKCGATYISGTTIKGRGQPPLLSATHPTASTFDCLPKWLPSKRADIKNVYYIDMSEKVAARVAINEEGPRKHASSHRPLSIETLILDFVKHTTKYSSSYTAAKCKDSIASIIASNATVAVPTSTPTSLIGILFCTTWTDYCKALVKAVEHTSIRGAPPLMLILQLHNSLVISTGRNARRRQLRMQNNQKQLRHHEHALKLMVDEDVLYGKGRVPSLRFYTHAATNMTKADIRCVFRMECINELLLQRVAANPQEYVGETIANVPSLSPYISCVANRTLVEYQSILDSYPKERVYKYIKLR